MLTPQFFLQRYATEVDVDFVRKAVRAIGRCAIKVEQSAERCVSTLLDLIHTKVNLSKIFPFDLLKLIIIIFSLIIPKLDYCRGLGLICGFSLGWLYRPRLALEH